MDSILEMISRHAPQAHWYIFGAIILAGFNVPFSIDVLLLLGAFLAAAVVPEHTVQLFLSILIGSYISAWCAYWLGRLVGQRLQKRKLFAGVLHPDKLQKIKGFYDKYGMLTLLIGRFIPFGVRNCIFMSSGMSRVHFGKFALMDALASSLWCTICFTLFYLLGQHYQILWNYLKAFNLVIFCAFGVTVIGLIWYKNRKKTHATKVST